MSTIIILVVLILILSYAINMLLLYSVGGLYRIFVAPGVILHELSHAFACIITGAPIQSINVFKSDGGEVKHGNPKIPIIGQILISLAPFIVGAITVYFLSKLLGIKESSINDLSTNASQIVGWVKHAFSSINFRDYKSWIALYLVLSIAVTMTPSGKDMKNIALSIVIVGIIIFIIYKYTHLRLDLSFLNNPALIAILSTTLILLIFGLVLSILVFAVRRILKPI